MDIDNNNNKPMQNRRLQPWVERYRPKRVQDVAYQQEVVDTLSNSIETGQLPHLLFYGPPGTGKTSTILALAHELWGPELIHTRLLELNASDERGISMVRQKIKKFAQTSVGTKKMDGYPSPQFKLIILDEADTMTSDAQSALRRTMEQYTNVTRFCLICNYVSRIIEPLASRCAKFRFKPLSHDTMINRLKYIALQEDVSFNDNIYDTIIQVAEGDLRKAVTILQSMQQLYGDLDNVSIDHVYEVSAIFPDSLLNELWETMSSVEGFEILQNKVNDIICEGYPIASFLTKIQDSTLTNNQLNDESKAMICQKISEVEMCLNDGANDQLQMLDLVAFISRQIKLQENV